MKGAGAGLPACNAWDMVAHLARVLAWLRSCSPPTWVRTSFMVHIVLHSAHVRQQALLFLALPAVARNEAPSHIMPINSLNSYQNRWTIKARVTQKSDIRRWAGTAAAMRMQQLLKCLNASEARQHVVHWGCEPSGSHSLQAYTRGLSNLLCFIYHCCSLPAMLMHLPGAPYLRYSPPHTLPQHVVLQVFKCARRGPLLLL